MNFKGFLMTRSVKMFISEISEVASIVSKNITDLSTKSGKIINLIDKLFDTVKNKVNIQENILGLIENLK
jgi:hypothetical protein